MRTNFATRCVKFTAFATAVALLGMATPDSASAQKKYDTGATDTEIKIGNATSYSGPASAYGAWTRAIVAYFKMVNDEGGINGRKINFVTYDDGYVPSKTVEQTRKLVEGDEVLFMLNVIGTPANSAIQKYLNQKGIPQLFAGSGAAKWNDPKNFPWSMGWMPSYRSEARVFARYIQKNYPGKTVGVLYQNDDFGKDFLLGLNDVFGADKSKTVVAEVSFEAIAPTVDSQVIQLKAANPDIVVNTAGQKAAAQSIRKMGEIGWKPIQFVTNISVSIAAVMKPAGFDNAQGVISTAYMKDADDPQWKDDPGMKAWRAFMTKYMPEANQSDSLNMYGYGVAKATVQLLKQAGDDLTRANVMKQAANLDLELETLLPQIKIKTGPNDFAPIEQLRLMRFKGESWELFSDVIDGG